MNVTLQFSFFDDALSRVAPTIKRLGFEIRKPLDWASVTSGDPRWREIRQMLIENIRSAFFVSEYDPEELRACRWLEVVPASHVGYPQPQSGFGYRAASYDLSQHCDVCDIGKRQSNPLVLSALPDWDVVDAFGLYWEDTEIFVLRRIWDTIFGRFGISSRSVLIGGNAMPCEEIVQLCVDEDELIDLEMEEFWPHEICGTCNRIKYHPGCLEWFHGVKHVQTNSHLIRTRQWFGGGNSAHRGTLMSGQLFRFLQDSGFRGLRFCPVKSLG